MGSLIAGGLAALLWVPASAPPLEAQETLEPEMEALLVRLLDLRTQESQLLEGLTEGERAVLLEALAQRLASEEVPAEEPAVSPSSSPTRPTAPPVTEASSERPTPAPPTLPETGAVPLPPRCNTLALFDTNADGRFSGADRHYRSFRLWRDTNRNGTPEESELESLLPAGVRSLDLDLRSYTSTRKDATGEVAVGNSIEVELLGKRGRTEVHVLALDTDSLESDGMHLENGVGDPLDGIVILQPGLVIVTAEGDRLELDCP